jgi:hypothetical protein
MPNIPPRRQETMMDTRKLTSLGRAALTNRNISSVQEPSSTLAGAELSTELYTYFAKPPVDGQLPVLYNGDRQLGIMILELETAGPVYVSTKQQLLPVTSGKGRQLITGQPVSFPLSKGNRLWVATTSINRIAVIVHPDPWSENITGLLGQIAKGRK